MATLSGGERRRVALCALLLSNPDMLLLDEPTNHLDAESVAWLERFLAEYPGTVVAVTHDRYFLDNVAGWILELDRGRGIPFEGNYSAWLENKENRLEQEASQEKARQRAIKAELDWVRANPKGRQAKSKSRLQRFEELFLEGISDPQRNLRALHTAGRTPGREGHRRAACEQRLRRPTADRGSRLQHPARRHRRHHRRQRCRANPPSSAC